MQALSEAEAMWRFGEAILRNSARSATLHKALDSSSKTSTISLFLLVSQHSATSSSTWLIPPSFNR